MTVLLSWAMAVTPPLTLMLPLLVLLMFGGFEAGHFFYTEQKIVQAVRGACLDSGCLLLGGETAEMPGLYADGHFDMAGFACAARLAG